MGIGRAHIERTRNARMKPLPPVDMSIAERARDRQGTLTKPTGSLEALEWLAVRMACAQGAQMPRARPAHVLRLPVRIKLSSFG